MSEDTLVTTVPRPEAHASWLPTGNEWVSLPTVDPASAAIHSVGAINMAKRGLVEMIGEARRPGTRPLLAPRLFFDDQPVDLARTGLRAERLHDFIPRFTLDTRGLHLTITVFAPPGKRGFVVLFAGTAEEAGPITLGLEGLFGGCELCLFQPRRPPCENLLFHDPWTGALVLEANLDGNLLALGIGCSEKARLATGPAASLARNQLTAAPAPIQELSSSNRGGTGLAFTADVPLALRAGEHFSVAFFVSVAPERDGARTGTIDFRREGAAALLERTEQHLAARRLTCGDPTLEPFLNRNALFNLYFAAGRALDTEEWVSLTSRSPAYYVSGATWERDSLLWSLPGLLAVDREVGREVLLSLFRRHARNAGEHAHYIDGSILYPGFELDELSAYFIALDRYLAQTNDQTLLDRPEIVDVLPQLEAKLAGRRHPDPEIELYSTFLLSSDDPTPHPWATYDNVMAWRALGTLARLAERRGDRLAAARHQAAAQRLARDVYRHLVEPKRGIFAWSADLAGEYRIYDEASGSLLLLPHLGFCAPSDPVWQRTVAHLHSTEYEFYHGASRFRGHGCLHYADPGMLGLPGALLGGRRDEALEVLRHAPLDGGLACESFDPTTGAARTGAAFATCAGFLTWALLEVLPPKTMAGRYKEAT